MANSTLAYIGLGSNLGDRQASINNAIKMLSAATEIEAVRTSELVETEPLSRPDHPMYLNAVAEIKTTLTPQALHKKIIDIETELGRVRREKWSPRTIDLDLLLFGEQIVQDPDLIIPHPQMHLRSFVLRGLCQLNHQLNHPVIEQPVNELAARLNGADFALDPDQPQLISIAGIIGVGKTTLTKNLARALACEQLFEPYDENPFMPDVYAGKKHLALDSELYFLTNRANQISPEELKPRQIYISDYIHDKSLIYAKCWLNDQQLAEYEKTYQPITSKVIKPVLVIYLQDSPQQCLQRIHQRGRPYEQEIQIEFLETLKSDYEHLFANWTTCPVIRISASELDVTKDRDVDNLAHQANNYIIV